MFHHEEGFSLVEILLASAVFSLVVTAITGALIYGRQQAVRSGMNTKAVFLMEEGIEALYSLRNSGMNVLTYTQSAVSSGGGSWAFLGEGTQETIGQYTRTITFADVCRNASNVIALCPSTYTDVHTKQATVEVEWATVPGGTRSLSSTVYLTNWNSTHWIQTDWRGGSGQTLWSDATKYDTDNGKFTISNSGQLTLAQIPVSGTWSLASGQFFTDTSDTNFNAGAHTNTVVSGSGTPASVQLAQAPTWFAHADSGVVSDDINDLGIVAANDIWGVGNSGKILHYDGTDWVENTDIGSIVLRGVDAVSSTNVWVVGDSGKFFQYNGVVWQELFDLGSSDIYAVDMLNASFGIAVGASGKFYTWNGTVWVETQDLGSQAVNSVSLIDASNAWAAGASGKIWRWNGVSWSEFVDTGNSVWNGIYMQNATTGWVVGNGGEIQSYDGVSWNTVVSPVTSDLNQVYMLTTSNGWAVGDSGKVISWDGVTWLENLDIGGDSLKAVALFSATSGFFVGANGIIYEYGTAFIQNGNFVSRVFDSGNNQTVWNTAAWSETLSNGSDLTLATRTGNTAVPDQTWSVWSGELTTPTGSVLSSPNGRYLQYRFTFTRGNNGKETPQLHDISLFANSPSTEDINDIDIVTPNDIWAVADKGEILHYNGSVWSLSADMGGSDILALDMLSATLGWATGQSEKWYQYNNGAWSEHSDTGGTQMNDIAILSSTDGWAVGKSGKIFHWDGNAWSEFTDTGGNQFLSLDVVLANDIWAAGNNGLMYHYDGTAWSQFVDTGDEEWRGIDVFSATYGFVVAKSGSIRRYDGVSWNVFSSPTPNDMNGLSLVSGSDGWMVGKNGEIFRWNGTAWETASSPTSEELTRVQFLSQTEGWAVGNNGVFVHFVGVAGGYETAGVLTSSAFNMGDASPVQSIEWDEVVPICAPACTVRLQVRGAPNVGGVPGVWSSWYGATGADTFFTVPKGTRVNKVLNGNQWVQYRISLDGDGANTPVLQEVRVNYR